MTRPNEVVVRRCCWCTGDLGFLLSPGGRSTRMMRSLAVQTPQRNLRPKLRSLLPRSRERPTSAYLATCFHSFTQHCLRDTIALLTRDRIQSPALAVYRRATTPTILQATNLGATNRNHGRRQDNHRLVLRTINHNKYSEAQYTNTRLTDPRHRLHPRHPLLRPLP